jgi:DNA-binding beta-propeller fold protein YncE|uniref:peptidyl-alpha-hydroxyglycine alpha-amidating lyase family protein n=1 Tax=Cephaloticoccus sp. TaxID=1985742 RepID=UPI0040499FDE
MNSTRAPAFIHSAKSRLRITPDWPQLPTHIKLFCVSAVALDSRGFLYVAHRGNNPLLRFNPDGSFDKEIGANIQRKTIGYNLMGAEPVPMDLRHWLHGLHIDPWDNLWVTDVGRHLVWRFDPVGNLTLTLGVDGVSGADSQHFYQPSHVWVTPAGDFFVADGYGNSRVVKYSATGKYLLEWGCRGTAVGEFHTPHVITSDPEGRLYIGDRENDRVQVFDQSGQPLAEWPGLHSVDGLHYAPDGFIYGGAGLDNAILKLDTNGQLLEVWAEPGVLNYPHGITVDAAGTIYVAETSGNRVLRVTREINYT